MIDVIRLLIDSFKTVDDLRKYGVIINGRGDKIISNFIRNKWD